MCVCALVSSLDVSGCKTEQRDMILKWQCDQQTVLCKTVAAVQCIICNLSQYRTGKGAASDDYVGKCTHIFTSKRIF